MAGTLNGTTTPPPAGLSTATLRFLAPLTAGTYEFRLFAANTGSRLTSSGPVHVSAPTAQLLVEDVASPTPVIVPPGTAVTVKVSGGPGNQSDWVGLYRVGDADGSFLSWQYLNGEAVPPVTGLSLAALRFVLPSTPGSYEFRFFLAGTYGRIATSTRVDVTQLEVAVSLTSPPSETRFAAGSIVPLSADVSVTGGSVSVVEFRANGQVIATCSTAPYAATWQATSPGWYELTAVVLDSAGARTSSAPHSITVETGGPSIVAHVTPAPNAAGWYTADVTVTFTCSPGATPIVSCTPPQLVQQDGVGIQVRGDAIDQAGLRATTIVVLNVDRTTVPAPPVITMVTPNAAPPGAFVTIYGAGFGATQGTSTVTFNGLTAPVTSWADNEILCSVPGSALALTRTGDALVRNASYFNPVQDFTMALWVKLAPQSATGWRTVYAIGDTTYNNSYVWIGTGPDNDVLTFEVWDGADWVDVSVAEPLVLGQWYHAALRYTASTQELVAYVDGAVIGSANFVMGPFVEQVEKIGDAAGAEQSDVSVAYVRNWDAALSTEEIQAERSSPQAVRTSHLLTDSPVNGPADLGDRSGHGHDWTAFGSPSPDSGPLVAPGAPIVVTVNGAQAVYTGFGEPTSPQVAVWLTSPASGQVYAVGSAIPVAATAVAVGRSVTSVDFRVGNLVVATANHQPFHASFEAATPGIFQMTALAHDDGGGETVSAPQSITIVANGPGIMAHVSPAPSGTGWYSGDVTVTFECTPGSAPLVSCSPPQDASADGRDVQVVGEAVDRAGLRAVAVVVLNVDQTAPRLSIYSPEDGAFIDPSSTTTTIRGNVLEPVSGVQWLTCGGVNATVSGQSFACDVPVSPGLNSVIVTARNGADLEASRTVSFSVSDPPAPTSLEVTPERMTMAASESRLIRVVDERGRIVTGATWSVDQALVAQVATDETRTRVTAIGAGEATLTVTKDGLSAQAVVTVLAAGVVPASGTVLWELHQVTDAVVKRGQVLRASPADDSDVATPDLYFVDEGTEWSGTELRRLVRSPDGDLGDDVRRATAVVEDVHRAHHQGCRRRCPRRLDPRARRHVRHVQPASATRATNRRRDRCGVVGVRRG